jgi:hypothetical protein
MRRALLLIGVLTGFGACAAGGWTDYVLTKTQVRPAYEVADFRFLHGGKTMPVVVHGTAFGLPEGEIGAAIGRHMTGHTLAAPTRLVSDQSAGTGTSRLAVKIAPPVDMSANSLCAGERLAETASPRGDGRLALLVAYCNRDRHLSSTHLTVDIPSGGQPVEAPTLRKALALTATKLFPARDPNEDSDRDFEMGG